MVLKIRYQDGRTNYKDIGSEFQYVQKHSVDFDKFFKEEFKMDAKMGEGCEGFIVHDTGADPIFNTFPALIYSNDGKLFMTLV